LLASGLAFPPFQIVRRSGRSIAYAALFADDTFEDLHYRRGTAKLGMTGRGTAAGVDAMTADSMAERMDHACGLYENFHHNRTPRLLSITNDNLALSLVLLKA